MEICLCQAVETLICAAVRVWMYDPVHGCSKRSPMTAGVGRAGNVMLVSGHRLVVAGVLQPMWAGFGDQLQCESYDLVHD